jgi:type I restriction enzyme S subunit
MKSDWEEVTLDSLKAARKSAFAMGPFGSNIKAENFTKSGVPVIKGGNLGGTYLNENKFDYLSQEKANELASSKARKFDLVITHRGTLGQVGLITETAKFSEYIVSQSQLKMSFDLNRVDPYYVYYFLRSPVGQLRLLSNTSQVGVPAIAQALSTLRQLQIPLPNLETQNNITSFLRALDDRITLLRETNTTLEAIAQALFKSWFIDFDPVHAKMQGQSPEGMDEATAALFPDSFDETESGPVPKGWKIKPLGEIVEKITKGTTPTTLKRHFTTSGINFIKAESMTENGNFIYQKFSFIDLETHEILKRSQLKLGDVLISIAGTIGRSAVVTEDFLPANTNQAVALIRPKNELFPSNLLWRFLKQKSTFEKLNERVVQAVQANLSLSSLSDLSVVLPPCELTSKLTDVIFLNIDQVKFVNNQKINFLSSIRDTLLPRLISGQLKVPEVN